MPSGSPRDADGRKSASTVTAGLTASGVLAPHVVVAPWHDHKIVVIVATLASRTTFAAVVIRTVPRERARTTTARTTDLARHPWMGTGPDAWEAPPP